MKNELKTGAFYLAKVTKVQPNLLELLVAEKYAATLTLADLHVPLTDSSMGMFYQEGQNIRVRVMELLPRLKVRPASLPADRYIKRHPIGCLVEAEVEHFIDNIVILRLERHVFAALVLKKHEIKLARRKSRRHNCLPCRITAYFPDDGIIDLEFSPHIEEC